MRNRFSEALSDTLVALRLLGVEVKRSPSKREADMMFNQVKNEILAVGFEEIVAIPRATDPKTDMAVALLSDAGESEVDDLDITMCTFHVSYKCLLVLRGKFLSGYRP